MSVNTLLTLLIIGGLGYMIFRGRGCCGSHGSRKGHHREGDETGSGKVKRNDTDR